MTTKQIILVVLLSALVSLLTSIVNHYGWQTDKKDQRQSSVGIATNQSRSDLYTQLEIQREQIDELRILLSALTNNTNQPISSPNPAPDSEQQDLVDDEPLAVEPSIEPERPVLSAQEIRRQRFIDNGFAADEVNWIFQNESDVQLDSLFEQHRARRAQAEQQAENGTRAKSRAEQLRERLGDDFYERYLEANGLPTKIDVNSVLANSPGADAGLEAGDKIISYDGERVFNLRDLNGLTILGDQGQPVLIEIERNGNPLQLSLPRGPIGIVGGRRRF